MKKIIFMVLMATFLFMGCNSVDVRANLPSTQEFFVQVGHGEDSYTIAFSDNSKDKQVKLAVVYKEKEYKCEFFYTAENPDVMGMIVDISTAEKTGAVGFKYKNASGMCGIQNLEDLEEPQEVEIEPETEEVEIEPETEEVEEETEEVEIEPETEEVEEETEEEDKKESSEK